MAEWDMLKKSLVKEPVLKYFDLALPLKVSTDASKEGLGAVLLQQHGPAWCPVAYASRTMMEAERNYAQIEKETLGAVFGCEKFHEYIYGREVVYMWTVYKKTYQCLRRNGDGLLKQQ